MVQPVQLCNPATVAGGHGDGACCEVSVAGMAGNARACDGVPPMVGAHRCFTEWWQVTGIAAQKMLGGRAFSRSLPR